MTEFTMRTGTGKPLYMSKEQIRSDLEDGANWAATKAKIPELSANEIDHILDILVRPGRQIGVEQGKEIVLTTDGGTTRYAGICRYSAMPVSREQAVIIGERFIGFDTFEIGHADYSFRPVKTIAMDEATVIENTELNSVIPVFYGAMPNLGIYFQSQGGKWPSPTDFMNEGKIDEARAVQESAAEDMTNDIVYVAKIFAETGLDGLDIDTTAAAGDADFYGTLKAIEIIKKETNLALEVGMAGEKVFGLHADLKYDGERLAGMWPHQQGLMVEKAGGDLFGAVINTDTGKSCPWNLARSITFVKEVMKTVSIPVHPNMGMGVGGIPMCEVIPMDVVTRSGVAMVELTNCDGV